MYESGLQWKHVAEMLGLVLCFALFGWIWTIAATVALVVLDSD